ncbi:MAG: putative LPS assembly protein LptD, partial [Flavobacterium sp.]|nr:putative LPS assembly protein LptD [Flavobacterium sp.]
MNISVSNTFEAKVKDKESKKGETKKVMLLNNLNFATRYDFNADSLKLKEISVSGGTQLLKQKMNINFAAILDPYAIDNSGKRIEKFNIDNGGSLLRLPRANITLNYSFSSSKGDDKSKTSEQNVQNGGRGDELFG